MNFNNSLRNNLQVIILFAIMVMCGCKKGFLDRDPQGSYTQETYPYPGGSGPYDTYLFGAYSELRQFRVHSQFFIFSTSVRSDDADRGSTATDGVPNSSDFDDFPVSVASTWNNDQWVGYFGFVNKCNIAIDQIKNNNAIVASPQIKLQSEAEARFLRGYAYFMLVRLYGRVPIIDSVTTLAGSNVPQSTPAATYSFIESDLQFAAANLPLSWDSKFVGRATSGAANGLLAKVYLTQGKWASAMSAAQTVMSSGQYDLSTTYDKIFREEGENSKESVFEVQATATSTVPTANGVQYAQIQGVRGAGIWNLGIGWNVPSTYLEAAYEAGDPRKARTILYMSTPTTTNQTIYGENTPVWNASGSTPNPRYNNKVYTNPSLRASNNSMSGWWMNIRILRYADVVLMFAEAANEVGGTANITAARNALNSVRARARIATPAPPAGTLPDITTTDQATLRDAIRRERRIELAMEHDRFFDLIRWGTAASVFAASGKPNFNINRDGWLPIPITQIDLSRNVLTQNPNY